MERFVGKVAVVTGCSAGIGAAIAKELVKNRLIVVGLARRLEKLEELAKELSSCGHNAGKFYPLKCDVTVETDVENSFQWITSKLGPVTVLINNAGIFRKSLLCDATADLITATFDTHVKAVVLFSNLAVKNMTDNAVKGHIININSVGGHALSNAFQPDEGIIYCSSKHALRVISEGFKRELAYKNSHIKVTNLSPGNVNTDMLSSVSLPTPSRTILQPKDIADVCISILSTPPHVLITELIVQHTNATF